MTKIAELKNGCDAFGNLYWNLAVVDADDFDCSHPGQGGPLDEVFKILKCSRMVKKARKPLSLRQIDDFQEIGVTPKLNVHRVWCQSVGDKERGPQRYERHMEVWFLLPSEC